MTRSLLFLSLLLCLPGSAGAQTMHAECGMFDLLNVVGRAKPGTMMLVAEAFDAVNASEGGRLHLPVGTRIQMQVGTGASVSAIAELDGKLRQIYFFAEQYHCVAVETDCKKVTS